MYALKDSMQHRCLNWRNYIFRNLENKEKGLISNQDCVELAIIILDVFVGGSDERLLEDARDDKINGLEPTSVMKKKKERRLQ